MSGNNAFGRRDFLKAGAGLLTAQGGAGLLSAQAAAADSKPYACKFYPFVDHPDADTCWSVSTGPDGRIYAAACAEGVPGGTVKVMRYNRERDKLDYLFDVGDKVGDPGNSGRATQCKIHYSFCASSDGILYMATHLTAPPSDLPVYDEWYSWHDEKRAFRGSALVAYDTRKDEILWWDTMIPKEGCRNLTFDEELGLLYSVSDPRDHFYVYDVKKRQRRDLGRISSINGVVILLDKKHRAYTPNDDGHLVRYTPWTGRLEVTPVRLPYEQSYQTGWHSVFYDAAPSPDGQCVYATPWVPNPHMMRIWLNEGEWPRIEDLGPVTQERDRTFPMDMFTDHCGGLVFAGDGKLYYVASRWRDPVYNPMAANRKEKEGVVWRLDPNTLQREEVALLEHPDGDAQYVSRAAVDNNGDLFFGHIGSRPAGIFKLSMPASRRKANAWLPLRKWG